jgi:hypothetical protein
MEELKREAAGLRVLRRVLRHADLLGRDLLSPTLDQGIEPRLAQVGQEKTHAIGLADVFRQ